MLKRILLPCLAVFLALAGLTYAGSGRMSIPGGVFNAGEVVYAADTNNLTGTAEVIASASGLKIGATSGTELTQIRVYSQIITPSSVAAGVCAMEMFTVTGVSTSDKIIYNPSGLLSPFATSVRAEAANGVGITFCNLNNSAQAPDAHTATFIAIRS